MLIKLAEILECPVSRLLGAEGEAKPDTDAVAQQLARINEQLAVKNRRSRRIWKIVGVVLAVFLLLQALLIALSYAAVDRYSLRTDSAVEVIEEEAALPAE